jgi:enoyl-CoA hydratase
MSNASIRLDRDARGVAFVTIDNSAKANALGTPLMQSFVRTIEDLGRDETLRAIVLTGAGDKAFVVGADIAEMARLDATGARAFITNVHRCCKAVRNAPVPVIARINGYAFGAGLELAAACDLRIAATSARFGMQEVRLGIPSVVEAAILPTLIGWGRTRELLLLGETIDAHTAQTWGLVERCVSAHELDAEIARVLHALLENGPRAIRIQKALINEWDGLPLAEAVERGIDAFAAAFASDEPRRMLGAFAARKSRP